MEFWLISFQDHQKRYAALYRAANFFRKHGTDEQFRDAMTEAREERAMMSVAAANYEMESRNAH